MMRSKEIKERYLAGKIKERFLTEKIKERFLTEKIKGKLAVSCSLVSWALLSASLLQFEVLRLGPYGIIHDLPLLYFAAVFLSLLSGFLAVGQKEKKDLLQINNYLFLLTALWLVPLLLEGTPRFASAYKTIGFVEYIFREGRLEPSNWEVFYHNWPGFPLLAAVIWLVTGIEEIYPLVLYYPFLFHLLMLSVLFWLFKLPLLCPNAPNAWYLGGVIYLLGNFINQDYFSPQSMAYFLLAIFTTLLLNRSQWTTNHKRALGYKISLVLILITLVVSHILSSLVALGMLFIFLLFDRKHFSNLVLLGIVVLAAWTVYGARVYFEAHYQNIAADMFEVKKAWNSNIDKRVQGSAEHIAVNKIRLLYAASIGLCGFIGFLLALRGMDRKTLLDLIKVSGVSACIAGVFVYGGESFMRAYLLLLLPLSFFSLAYAKHSRCLAFLCVFSILSVPFQLIAHYGNEQVDYVSPGIIKGTDFLPQHSRGGYVVGCHQILGNTKYTENFISLKWEQFINDYSPEKKQGKTYYLGLGPRERDYWSIFYDDPRYIDILALKLREDKRYVLFYSNGEIDLYYLKS